MNNVGIIPNDILNVKTKIKNFETNNSVIFPQDYKEFLLKYNGGKTNKVKFTKDGWQSEFYGDSICIEEFYSIENINIAYQEKIDEQKFDFENIEQISTMVPIASASGDYSILMSLDKEANGEIYLQDDRNRKFFSITHITNSFGDLLLNLEKENTVVGNLLQKRMLKNAKTEEEKKNINTLFDKDAEKENYTNLEI